MESDLQPTYGPERKVHSTPRRLADISKAKRLLNFETVYRSSKGCVN
jgi:UDP-glucose 4-epimerase